MLKLSQPMLWALATAFLEASTPAAAQAPSPNSTAAAPPSGLEARLSCVAEHQCRCPQGGGWGLGGGFVPRPARPLAATELAVARGAVLLPGHDRDVFEARYGGRTGVFWIDLHLITARVRGVIVIGDAPFAHVGRALVTGERSQEQNRQGGAPERPGLRRCGARTWRLNHSKTLPPPVGSRPKYFLPPSSAT